MSIYQAVFKGNTPGPNALRNIHHYEFPGYVPTGEELEEFVQGLADRMEEFLVPLISNAVTLSSIEVRRVDIGDQPGQDIIPDGWPRTGSAVNQLLPPQVAAIVTWKAPTAYPRSTRTYVFPFTATNLSAGGTIVLGARTALDNWALVMEQVEVTGQPDAQKVAVQYGGDPRVVVASNLVFAQPVGSVWATQRSRRFGVGI